MTAAWQQQRLLELGNEGTQVRYQPLHSREVDNQVLLTSDKEGWGTHQGSRPCRHQFPALINRTIPIEATAEARSLKFARIIVNVLLCQPGRQCLRVEKNVENAPALWHDWL